jgi:hypothetical protein
MDWQPFRGGDREAAINRRAIIRSSGQARSRNDWTKRGSNIGHTFMMRKIEVPRSLRGDSAGQRTSGLQGHVLSKYACLESISR